MSLARDMAVPIDCGTNLADILSNALPPDKRSHEKDKPLSDSSVSLQTVYYIGKISCFGAIENFNYRMEAARYQSQQVPVALVATVHTVKLPVLNFIILIQIPL